MRFLCNGNSIIERYFGGKFGRIEPGYTADLVILDYENPTPMTGSNTAGHFIFGLNAVSVYSTIINGHPVYENRRFPFATQPLYEKAREEASKLWKEIERY
jgi:cytosine/adenosine deaminase-related metal-dependent hydrolase